MCEQQTGLGYVLIERGKSWAALDGFRVAVLFLVNRLFLFGVGVMSALLFSDVIRKPDAHILSSEVWLQIWGAWDSCFFLSTAQHGYVADGDLRRFPLYPLAIRAVSCLVGDYFVAALLVSNLALIAACIFLYRLMALEGSTACARNACKYLLLFPSSCVLSGAFSESLCLAMMLGSFYYARKQSWLTAGLMGFCASLTRSVGFVIVIPLVYEYMRLRGFRLRAIRPDLLFMGLVPAGTVLFSAYLYVLTGNFFAYVDQSVHDGNAGCYSPFLVIQRILFSYRYQSVDYFFNTCLTVLSILALTVFARKIGMTYWLLGMLLIFVPLMSVDWFLVMSRYLVVVFPLFILLARLGAEHPWLDELMTMAFGIIQGFVMAVWVVGMRLVV